MEIAIGVIGVIVILAVIAIALHINRGVQVYHLVEYERIAVFKATGEFKGIRGPGRVYIWPPFFFLGGEQVRDQNGQPVKKSDIDKEDSTFDLREQPKPLDEEHCITGDTAVVGIAPTVIYQITDPEKLVLNINRHIVALDNATKAILRSVVGNMALTEVIAGRETVAAQVEARLAEQADRWGINVISVEIQDVKPDQAVEEAMNKRRAAEEEAEKDRQELVVRADARRQGGEIENETLVAQAETEKRIAITKAEGEKEAELIKAEGISALYKMLMDLGTGADVALRYEQIQALRNFGDSSNSKLVIVPANMGMMGSISELPLIEGAMPSTPSHPEATA